MVPLITAILLMSQHEAHMTSLAAIVPIAVVGAIGLASAGEVDVELALPIAAGALFGAPVGARVMSRVSEGLLKVAFGTVMAAVALRLWWG